MATKTFGLLAGRRALLLYVPALVVQPFLWLLYGNSDDWRPLPVAALLLVTTLGLDTMARVMDDSWGTRYTIGSAAVVLIAMIVLGPVPAGILGAGSALIDSLLLRARWQMAASNVIIYGLTPLLGGLVWDHWIAPEDGASLVVTAFVLALACDAALTFTTAVFQHLTGFAHFASGTRLYFRQLPWSGVLAVIVASGVYGYEVGGTGVLAIALVGLVVSEALLLKLDGAERELRAERDLHEKYLRMVGTAVVSLDPDLRITLANRRAIELLGLPAEEDAIGRDWIEVIGVRGPAHAERRRWGRMFDGLPTSDSFQTELRVGHGPPRVVSWHSTLVNGRDGLATSLLLAGEDVTDQRLAERRMAYLAYNDALTGLPNRTSFDQELPTMLAEADACGCAAALLFMDLDGFKRINDRHGHEGGDRLLAEAAARLRAVADGDDLLVRRGGDEFLMLVPDLAVDASDAPAARRAAAAVAERVARAFDAPFPIAGITVRIGISVGSAVYPLDATDADGLQRAADASMYGLKQRANS